MRTTDSIAHGLLGTPGRRLLLIAFATALATTASVTAARADVACSIWEIEASSGSAPSVDADLKPLQKKLAKPPFASWNVFKRIGAHDFTLAPQGVGSATLVHGKAALVFRDVTARSGRKPRVALSVTIDDAAGKRTLDTKVNIDAGDFFLVGQALSPTKSQLVAFTCRP